MTPGLILRESSSNYTCEPISLARFFLSAPKNRIFCLLQMPLFVYVSLLIFQNVICPWLMQGAIIRKLNICETSTFVLLGMVFRWSWLCVCCLKIVKLEDLGRAHLYVVSLLDWHVVQRACPLAVLQTGYRQHYYTNWCKFITAMLWGQCSTRQHLGYKVSSSSAKMI